VTDEELRALLEEQDDLRLAIRGFTVIETMLDDAIADASPGRWEETPATVLKDVIYVIHRGVRHMIEWSVSGVTRSAKD
jgi:hypothetical protein